MEQEKRPGHYLGTERDGKWWKRATDQGLLARGNGTWWMDEEHFLFHRYLTKEPIRIPRHRITGVTLGKWHSGRWANGLPVLKIHWDREGTPLVSGFLLAKDETATRTLQQRIQGHGPS